MRIGVKPIQEAWSSNADVLLYLLGAGMFLMLIACANAANLMLARSESRRELAVRAALGAGRRRLIRQMLTETLLVASFGGLLGLLFTYWSIPWVVSLIPENMARFTFPGGTQSITLDPRVLLFTLGLTLLTVLVFGLAPALSASRVDLNEAIKLGQRSSAVDYLRTGTHPWSIVGVRGLLVIAEVSLSLILLWYTIVGVVKEIRERSVRKDLGPAVYLLHEQTDQWSTSGAQPIAIVVRTAVEPASLVPAIRQAIWSVDKNQPIARVQTIQEIFDRQLFTQSQSTALLSAFALLALLLASIGLYGVISYGVTQRTNEIGVRMALGATSRDILFSFGRRGLALTLAGLAMGLALSLGAVRLMTSLIYGFQPNHAIAGTVVSVILLAVAMVACSVPARRAARLDPVVALKHE